VGPPDLHVPAKVESHDIIFFGTLNSQFTFDPLLFESKVIYEKFPKVRFLIYGDGESREILERKFTQCPNVTFMGALPYQDLLQRAANARAFFCFYSNVDLFSGHLTNKLLDYLAFDKAIIHNFTSAIFFNGSKIDLGVSVCNHSLLECVEVAYLKARWNHSELRLKFSHEINFHRFRNLIEAL
jgi:hypothetical protein